MPRSRKSYSSHGASRGNAGGRPGKARAGGGRPPRPGQGGQGGQSGQGISPNRRHGFADGRRPYDYAAYEREAATPEYLARLFAGHGVEASARQLEQFWRYYELLREHNARLDLTRIMGIEATVLKHFVDSLWPDRLAALRGPLLDIGSGPGFPGAPLAIMRPERPVILAESRGKRVEFLEMLRRELKLDNVTIHPHSVREDSPFVGAPNVADASNASNASDSPTPCPADGRLAVRDVVTRALETIGPTLARVRAFVPPGGRVYFLKGPQCGQEISEAQTATKFVYKMVLDTRYDLPGTDQHRRLVAFERRGLERENER